MFFRNTQSKFGLPLLFFTVVFIIWGCEKNSAADLESFLQSNSDTTLTSTSLEFSPVALNFGAVAAGSASLTQNITAINKSQSDIFFGTLATTPDSSGFFSLASSTCPEKDQSLKASGSCTFTIQFVPTTATPGDLTANFSLAFGSAPASSSQQALFKADTTVTAPLSTAVGNAALAFAPNVYEFPRTAVAESTNKDVTLTNSSTLPIYVKEFSGISLPFAITSHNCPTISEGGIALAPATSCILKLSFTPSAVGSAAAYLQVSYAIDAGATEFLSASMGLTGSSITVGNSAIAFEPTSMDIGTISITAPQELSTVTLTNAAGAKLYIKNISGFDDNFVNVASSCPVGATVFAAGAQCDITVGFSPQSAGSFAANVIVNYDLVVGKSGFNSSIAFNGTGVGALNFSGVKDIGTATQNTTTQLNINWDLASGGDVSRYYVYRIATNGQKIYVADVPGTQSSYVNTGLSPGTSYTYLVKASDVLGVPDANNTRVTQATDPLGSFADVAIGTLSEGQTTQSADLGCTNNHSEAISPIPTFSVIAQSDADANCSISGSGPYKLLCVPAFKTGHSAWNSNVTIRCALNGSNLDHTLNLTVNDANRAPTLANVSSRSVVVGAAMTGVNAADSVTNIDADQDGDVLSYTCRFDTLVNGSVASGASNCTTLSGTASFNTVTGALNWTPNSSAVGGGSSSYEIAIQASDGYTTPLSGETLFTVTVNGAVITQVTSNTSSGTYKAGDTIDIRAVFSGPVTVTGNPYFLLETGTSDAQAPYSSGSGSSTIVFNYTVQNGDVSTLLEAQSVSAIALNGGTMVDQYGNPAALTVPTLASANSLSGAKNIVIDGQAPNPLYVTSSSANSSYGTGSSISLQVVFNEVVTVTGTPTLKLETGATDEIVSYVSGSGSTTLNFTYTVQASDNSGHLDYHSTTALTLAGGTIKDAVGNNASLTLPPLASANSLYGKKNLIVDGTTPTVAAVSSSKVNGSYKAGVSIPISVSFSEVVVVTGSPQLTLETGTTDQVINYVSGTGSSGLIFSYVVQAGQITPDLDYVGIGSLGLNSGTIKDTAGNNAVLTLAVPGAAGSISDAKNIAIDTEAPTVSSVTSNTSNGTYKAGDVIDVRVSFSDAVTVTGTPVITLATGNSDVASYQSGTGTTVLVFSYTVQSGANTSDLDYASIGALDTNGGSIVDVASNDAILTLPTVGGAHSIAGQKVIVIDTTAPTVSGVDSSTPNGSWAQGNSISIQVTFSENPTVSTTGGTPRLKLNVTPTTRYATYASLSGAVATFTYVVQAGDLSSDLDCFSTAALELNGGTIVDAVGNSANLTLQPPGAAGSLGLAKNLVIRGTNVVPSLSASLASQTVSTTAAITAVNVNDSSTNGDTDSEGDAISYTCKFDTSTNSAMDSGGTTCASLPSNSFSFGAATGLLAWTPSSAATTTSPTTYEFEVIGTDSAHSSATIYFTVTVQPSITLTAVANKTFANGTALVAGSAMTAINFDDSITGSDTGVTYSCVFDTVVDNAVSAGSACTSLNGTATFNTSTGVLNWTPLNSGNYEVKVSGTRDGITNSAIFVLQVRPAYSVTNLLTSFDAIFADNSTTFGVNTPNTSTWKNLSATASADGLLTNFSFSTSSGWAGDGTVPITSAATGPYRLHFDGVDDYIDFGTAVNSSADFSFETWINPANANAKGSTIFSNGVTASGGTTNETDLGLTLTQSSTSAGKLELSLGQKSYADEILSESSLVAYWRLGEKFGSKALDSKGSFHGTYSTTTASPVLNAAHTGWGTSDTAVQFPNDGYVSVPAILENTISGDDTHTIEFWFNVDAFGTSLLFDCSVDVSSYCWIQFGNATGIYWGYGGGYRTYTVPAMSTGSWYHLVAVKTGSGDAGTLYLNGQPLSNYVGSLGNMPSGTGKMFIGRFRDGGYNVNGLMDEVALYSAPLSQARVQAHYYAAAKRLTCAALTSISSDSWHHVAGSFSSSGPTLKLYLDGIEQCSQTLAGASFNGSVNDFNLGRSTSSSTDSWQGGILDLRTFSSQLTNSTLEANRVATRTRVAGTLPFKTNLKMWMKADEITGLADGDAVSFWNDVSLSGNTLFQNTANNRPVYKTNSVNSTLPTVRLDGTNSYMTTSTNFGTNNSLAGDLQTSVFAVYKKTLSTNGPAWGWGSTGVAAGSFGVYDDGSLLFLAYAGGIANGMQFSSLPTNSFNIHSVVKSAGALNSTTRMYLDGAVNEVAGGNATTPGVTGAQAFTLGQWSDYTGLRFKGDMAELLVFGGAMTDSDRQKIEGYLAHKYGLTGNLPANHPFKTTPP